MLKDITDDMLIEKLQQDLKKAQLARSEIEVSTLRLLLSEIKNLEIAKGKELIDQDIISVIQKEVKKRQEASVAFRQGGREDSAQREVAELAILKTYLPDQLSTEELTKIVEESINEVGAKTIQDMGKVMGIAMGKVAGKADGGAVSALVKEKLTI